MALAKTEIMTTQIHAGGGVIWRPNKSGSVDVLLVHRPGYKDWTFPKGKQDDGEAIRMTARREVAEETNLHCRLGKFLGTIQYETGGGSEKTVHLWEMAYSHGSFKPNSEVDKVLWVPAEKVTKKLTYRRDREFYDSLKTNWWVGKPWVQLIRHAEAGNRRTWTGEDQTRPLAPIGRQQAIALREKFADQGLDRIVSSPYVRCVQTVEPLSAATGIEIEKHPDLAEGANPKATAALLRELAEGRSVACSHGDVITDVMNYLVRRGMRLSEPFDTKKASVWKLSGADGKISKAKYQPPPAV